MHDDNWRRHAVQSPKKLRKDDVEEFNVNQSRGQSSSICDHNMDASVSQKSRFSESGKEKHEEHVADLGHNSTRLHNLVHLPEANTWTLSNDKKRWVGSDETG